MNEQNATAIKWAAILGAGYFLIRGVIKPVILAPVKIANYFSRLRFNISGVKLKGQNLEFELFIQNPNEIPLQIHSVVGDVYLESNGGKTIYKLGNVSRYGFVTVKSNNETKYAFSLRLKLLQLAGALTDFLAGKLKGRYLHFIGTININGADWPLNLTYKI